MSSTVDAHHHFWDIVSDPPEWLEAEGLEPLRRSFGTRDLEPLLRENGIDASVLVEAQSSARETEQLLEIAEKTGFVAGVVGWVDLRSPSIADDIARLRAGSNGRWLVGIRHPVQGEDDDWLAQEDVIRGLRAVGDASLVYDILVFPRHLPAALTAVKAAPETRFVINHIAKPPIASGELEPWAARMQSLAELPNVWCKVSGMVTEADHEHWTPDDLRPYAERVCTWFGKDRLLFGSDWPVCLLASSYGQVVKALREVLGEISETEERRIFGENATELYRLRLED